MDTTIVGDSNDSDFFEKNRGKGELCSKGPECIFRGKTTPCLVRWYFLDLARCTPDLGLP